MDSAFRDGSSPTKQMVAPLNSTVTVYIIVAVVAGSAFFLSASVVTNLQACSDGDDSTSYARSQAFAQQGAVAECLRPALLGPFRGLGRCLAQLGGGEAVSKRHAGRGEHPSGLEGDHGRACLQSRSPWFRPLPQMTLTPSPASGGVWERGVLSGDSVGGGVSAGLTKEDVKVTVEDGNTLQITGERNHEGVGKDDKWHRVERSHSKFLRRFRLPDNTNVDAVKATVSHGVLTVTVPKNTSSKHSAPRYVDVA